MEKSIENLWKSVEIYGQSIEILWDRMESLKNICGMSVEIFEHLWKIMFIIRETLKMRYNMV